MSSGKKTRAPHMRAGLFVQMRTCGPKDSDTGGFGIGGIALGHLDAAGKAKFGEEPDAPEVGIELVPPEAVTR